MAAGYALYGSATLLVLSVGSGLVEFTLDQGFRFRLTGTQLKVPQSAKLDFLDQSKKVIWIQRIKLCFFLSGPVLNSALEKYWAQKSKVH